MCWGWAGGWWWPAGLVVGFSWLWGGGMQQFSFLGWWWWWCCWPSVPLHVGPTAAAGAAHVRAAWLCTLPLLCCQQGPAATPRDCLSAHPPGPLPPHRHFKNQQKVSSFTEAVHGMAASASRCVMGWGLPLLLLCCCCGCGACGLSCSLCCAALPVVPVPMDR